MNIAAQHYHSQLTSTQQTAKSHDLLFINKRLNEGSEEGLQVTGPLQPDQEKRPRQTHASHSQHRGEISGGESNNGRDPSCQQPDQRYRTRQSHSRQDTLDHEPSQRKPDQYLDAAKSNTASDQSSSKSNNAGSSDTNSKVSTAAVIIADTLALPHPDCSFDFAICIAVIHHLSTRERRVKAVSHIVSKLRTNARSRSSGELYRSLQRNARNSSSRSPGRNDPADGGGGDRKSNLGCDEGSQSELESVRDLAMEGEGGRAAVGDRIGSDTLPGQALIFVWALEQKSSRRGFDTGDSQDQLVPWVLKPDPNTRSTKQRRLKPSKESASAKMNAEGQCSAVSQAEPCNDDGQDRALTNDAIAGNANQHINQETREKLSEKTFHRFYHLYQEGELESECAEAGASVVEKGFDRDNWWVIVEPGNEAEGR